MAKKFYGGIDIQDQSDLRFFDADSSNSVALQSPATLSANYTLTLPPDDGNANQVLSTNGSGVLDWVDSLTNALSEDNILIGNASNVATAVDTTVVGDIEADATAGLTIKAGVIVNADINASAAIDFSKLAALTDGNLLIGNGSNVATSVDLTSIGDIEASSAGGLTIKAGAIVDADVNASAAITLSKLASVTASRALVSDGSGVISVSSATSAEVAFLSGVTSAIQTQLDAKLALAGGTMSGAIAMGSNKITGLADGTATNDAVNKGQLDAAVAGLTWKDAVRVASAANVASLTGITAANFDGTGQGVTLVSGDRVLLKDQSTGSQNGIYTYDGADLVRATDMDGGSEADGAAAFVQEGTSADQAYTQTADSVTIGTTAMVWVQFTGLGQITAGTGLSKTANTLNVGDVNRGVQVNADDLEIDASESAGEGIKENTTNSWQFDVDHDGEGLTFVSSQLALELDGSTLSKSATGVKVADGGITNTQVNASAAIALSKIEDFRHNATWANADGTSKAVSHSLGSKNVIVQVYDTANDETIEVDSVVRTDANTVTLTASSAPATNWEVLILKVD